MKWPKHSIANGLEYLNYVKLKIYKLNKFYKRFLLFNVKNIFLK